MKFLLLTLSLLATSCAYSPWRYENYHTVDAAGYQNGYFKSDTFLLKIAVIATELNPDLRKAPYKLWINYIDHTMEFETLQLCSLNVITSEGRKIIQDSGQCNALQLKVGSLTAGIKPYAKAVIFQHAGMDLNFEGGEKLYVSFSYYLTSSASKKTKIKEIKLLFEPVLEKGLTKPCCWPSV